MNSTFNSSETVFVNQTSDPYQLALTLLAVAYAPLNQTTNVTNATRLNLANQLAKHFNATTGIFQSSPRTVNTTSSPFNSQENEKVVE
jgi:hypothetical protein